MIMEYYDLGLALLVNEFCWSIEDVAYLKVNAQEAVSEFIKHNHFARHKLTILNQKSF